MMLDEIMEGLCSDSGWKTEDYNYLCDGRRIICFNGNEIVIDYATELKEAAIKCLRFHLLMERLKERRKPSK